MSKPDNLENNISSMNNKFYCPSCDQHDVLIINTTVDIPEHTQYDEVCVQSIQCLSCDKHGMAVYEESRRGSLQDESVNHFGYWLEPESQINLDRLLKSCQENQTKDVSITKLIQIYKNLFTNKEIKVDLSTQFNIEV